MKHETNIRKACPKIFLMYIHDRWLTAWTFQGVFSPVFGFECMLRWLQNEVHTKGAYKRRKPGKLEVLGNSECGKLWEISGNFRILSLEQKIDVNFF